MTDHEQIGDEQINDDERTAQRFGLALLFGIAGACTLFVVVGAAVSALAH
jgi:hypothetical protein